MKCPYCNDSIHPNAKFCPKCGLGLKDEATMMGSYVEEESGPNRWVVAGGAAGIVTIALLIGWMSGGGAGQKPAGPAPLPASASAGSVIAPTSSTSPMPVTGVTLGTPPAPGFTAFPTPSASWSAGPGLASTQVAPVQMSPAPVPPLGYTAPERQPQKPRPAPEPEVLAPPQMAMVQQMTRRSNQAEVTAKFPVIPPAPDFGSTQSPLQRMGLDPADTRREHMRQFLDPQSMPTMGSNPAFGTEGSGGAQTPQANDTLAPRFDLVLNGPAIAPGETRMAVAPQRVEGENSPWVYDPVHERWARRPGWGEPKPRVVRSQVDSDRSLRSGRVRVSAPLTDR